VQSSNGAQEQFRLQFRGFRPPYNNQACKFSIINFSRFSKAFLRGNWRRSKEFAIRQPSCNSSVRSIFATSAHLIVRIVAVRMVEVLSIGAIKMNEHAASCYCYNESHTCQVLVEFVGLVASSATRRVHFDCVADLGPRRASCGCLPTSIKLHLGKRM